MSYYDIVYKGDPCRFEIGGDWNRKFLSSSSNKECAQAVIPVWTVCDGFMKRLVALPGSTMSTDRSIRTSISRKTVIVSYAANSKMAGFWMTCDNEKLVYTRALSQPTFIQATSSQLVAWFMDHHEELEDALLDSDSDEESLDKIPDDPRYLIRVGRRSKEIEDSEMAQITIKEVL